MCTKMTIFIYDDRKLKIKNFRRKEANQKIQSKKEIAREEKFPNAFPLVNG